MSSSQISPEKVRAYHATSYRLGHTNADIVLNIGILSPPVITLFRTRQVTCGAFVIAFNPYGVQQSDAENERAHARLLNQVGPEVKTDLTGLRSGAFSFWGWFFLTQRSWGNSLSRTPLAGLAQTERHS